MCVSTHLPAACPRGRRGAGWRRGTWAGAPRGWCARWGYGIKNIYNCNIIYAIHLCRPVMSALVSRPPRNLGQSRSSTLSPSRHRNCSNPSLPGERRDKYTLALWWSLETKQFEFEWTSKEKWGNRETLCEWVSKFYLLLLLTLFHFTIFIINLATMNVFQHDIFIS